MVLLIVLNIIAAFALPTVCSYEETPAFGNDNMFLRLHVRANSDSEEDQELKLCVRDAILQKTTLLLADCEDKDSAIEILTENFGVLREAAEKTVAEKGFDYPISIEIRKEHFEYREYDGFFLPEDTYDSLIVNVGSGEGHNWWCVVFPAVCLSGSSSKEADDNKTPEENENDAELDGEENEKTDNEEEKDVTASVEVDLSAVPEEYHLAKDPVPEKVVYDFWIVRFFKDLFGIK